MRYNTQCGAYNITPQRNTLRTLMVVFSEHSLYRAEYLNKAVNLREAKQYILF